MSPRLTTKHENGRAANPSRDQSGPKGRVGSGHPTLRLLACLLLSTAATAFAERACPWTDVPAERIDANSIYKEHWGELRPGERLVIRGEFPHARFMSFTVYSDVDQRLDSLIDVDLLEIRGWNPFLPGMDRHKPYFGEYEIDVRMEPRPAQTRAANTLYIGAPGQTFRLVYQVVLLDDTLPGRLPPSLTYRDAKNRSHCPAVAAPPGSPSMKPVPVGYPDNPSWLGLNDNGVRIYRANIQLTDRKIVRVNVPEFRAPLEADRAEPFPEKADVRYWSISFGDPAERTIADFEIPASRRIFVGGNGMARPEGIPREEWIGLRITQGPVTVRMVLVGVPQPSGLVPQLTYMTPVGVR